MTSARAMIEKMPAAFRPEAAGNLSMRVVYAIEQPMTVIIEHGTCHVIDGAIESPDVTLRIRDAHLVKLMTGRMRGITAFMTGKLKVEGNYALARTLQDIFDRERLTD